MTSDDFRNDDVRLEDGNGLARRRALTVLALAAPTLAAGCALGSGEAPTSNQDPDLDAATGDDSGITDPDAGSSEAGGACTSGAKVGTVNDFVVGQWKKVTGGSTKFNVGRDANGLWAYANTCTHNNSCQIGTPGASTGTITCPCHGAQFDGNGGVTRGPASRPLANYKVIVCGGDVYVDRTQVVPSGTRTPV